MSLGDGCMQELREKEEKEEEKGTQFTGVVLRVKQSATNQPSPVRHLRYFAMGYEESGEKRWRL